MKKYNPFGPDWKYVSVEMGSRDGIGFHRQLWKHKKTGELKWHDLTKKP